MDKEKMNGRELTEKEMEQVSGGTPGGTPKEKVCFYIINDLPCMSPSKKFLQCATCPKNN